MEETMIRLIVFSAFSLAVATSAKAMSPAPLHQPDGMITQVICGPGQVRSKTGNCVWKTTNANRPIKSGDGYRRCVAWSEGFCVQYR
jgi:hypothetical protein